MGAHRSVVDGGKYDYVVLDGLGDRTIEHDGKIVLTKPFLDAVEDAYAELNLGAETDLKEVVERATAELDRRSELGIGGINVDVDIALGHLDSVGRIRLNCPESGGRHRADD